MRFAIAVAGIAMAVAAASPASAAASGGHRVLPKGTPYAAEVIATIIGESHLVFTSTETYFDICETESKVEDESNDYDLYWTARYPQVTVPVADEKQLGRAYKKLHVRVQPTSDGSGGLRKGIFHITGHYPPTDAGNQGVGGSDCASQAYDTFGSFTAATHPTFSDLTYRDGVEDVFDVPRQVFDFQLGTVDAASPATYTLPNGAQGDPVAELRLAATSAQGAPPLLNVPPGVDNVPADFTSAQLKPLVEKPSVTFYRRTDGSSDCGTSAKVEWNYQFRIKLTRRFLYRTKAAYAK